MRVYCFLQMHCSGYNVSEVEWRTQRSRPRIQKKSEAKDRLFEDRTSQGQVQE